MSNWSPLPVATVAPFLSSVIVAPWSPVVMLQNAVVVVPYVSELDGENVTLTEDTSLFTT